MCTIWEVTRTYLASSIDPREKAELIVDIAHFKKEVIYLKTMTCKQLYGPCDAPIHGATSEEMIKNSQSHGIEMATKGNQGHIRVMEEMKQGINDPEAVKQWMEKFQKEFDAQPED